MEFGVLQVSATICTVQQPLELKSEKGKKLNHSEKQHNARVVLTAGILFNLSIGILFVWGEFKRLFMMPVNDGGWGWTSSQAGIPFTTAILFYALGVLIGGRVQDRTGPRIVVSIGGFMVGLGLILCSLFGNDPKSVMICFGIISGFGIGLGYSSVNPPALKWFHPSKRGVINGLIIGGFGYAAIFYAPIVVSFFNKMLNLYGFEIAIKNTFLYLGLFVLVVSTTIAQFIKNPPSDHIPDLPKDIDHYEPKYNREMTTTMMLKTKLFFLIAILFLFSTTVGLMIIGNISRIAYIQAGIEKTALLVSLLAFMNGLGRLFGGMLSDKIGRTNTIGIVLAVQTLNMLFFLYYSTLSGIILGVVCAGLCYGTLVSVFPSMVADQFGMEHYGNNYGVVYMFWGLAGIVAPFLSDIAFDNTGRFDMAYMICAGIMPALILVNILLKKEMQVVSTKKTG